jgi:hypothetical protein
MRQGVILPVELVVDYVIDAGDRYFISWFKVLIVV